MSPGLGAEMQGFFQSYVPFLSAPPQMDLKEGQGQDKLKKTSLQLQYGCRKEKNHPGKLTSRFNFREESSHFLALHNVSDDVACYLGIGAICNDH